MAAELRWILTALSALLLAGIWWWGARRSSQAPGNAELRESPRASSVALESNVMLAPDSGSREAAFHADSHEFSRDWGVPPFEPLSIRTADFEQLPIVELPMTAQADSIGEIMELSIEHPAENGAVTVSDAAKAAAAFPATFAVPAGASADALQADAPSALIAATATAPAAVAAPASAAMPARASASASESARAPATSGMPNGQETQRIVTLRVCAEGDSRWAGAELMLALDAHGLAYGRYQVFHRKHSDGRTLFCAASLIEPGTFNLARMPQEEFRGLTLFAVLPGPVDSVQTLDALIETARELAATLRGTVQDPTGMPLSPQRAVALREDVARFQASLNMA